MSLTLLLTEQWADGAVTITADPPVVTAVGEMIVPPPFAAIVAGPPVVAATGTMIPPTMAGSAAIVADAPVVAALGTNVKPTFLGAVVVVAGAPVVAAAGTTGAVTRTGIAAVVAGAPVVAAIGTNAKPIYSGTAAIVAGAPTVAGVGPAPGTVLGPSVTPASLPARSPGTKLTVRGLTVNPTSLIRWDGLGRATVYRQVIGTFAGGGLPLLLMGGGGAVETTGEVSTTIPARDLLLDRTVAITVVTDGVESAPLWLTITPAVVPVPAREQWLPDALIFALVTDDGYQLVSDDGYQLVVEE